MAWRDGIDAITSDKISTIEKNWPIWHFRCTSWEAEFMADILVQWRIYGPQMNLSAKQRNILTEIYDKIRD